MEGVLPAAEDGEVAGGVIEGRPGGGAGAVAEEFGLDVAIGAGGRGIELDAHVGGQCLVEPNRVVARALAAEPAPLDAPVAAERAPVVAQRRALEIVLEGSCERRRARVWG